VSHLTLGLVSKPNRYHGRVPLPSLGRLNSRSNGKPINPGKHRNSAAKETDGAVEDHELTSYLAALAPDSDPESTGTGKRFGEAQVYQLRMSLIASEQLKAIALERNSSPSALAQEWILERLSWESQGTAEQSRYAQQEQPQEHDRYPTHEEQAAYEQPGYAQQNVDPQYPAAQYSGYERYQGYQYPAAQPQDQQYQGGQYPEERYQAAQYHDHGWPQAAAGGR
jgi:hypothetical protein